MTSPLDDYNRKRNFDRTAEPPGTAAPRDDGAAGGCDGRLRFARPLRPAPRMERDAAELGRSQRSFVQPPR